MKKLKTVFGHICAFAGILLLVASFAGQLQAQTDNGGPWGGNCGNGNGNGGSVDCNHTATANGTEPVPEPGSLTILGAAALSGLIARRVIKKK